MVIMGLNMLNIFPWLRRFNLHTPKFFADKIHSGKRNGPIYVGLLNGLMPCGPLQAMQLYALSTGSFVKGAFSMFLFSAGTLPLMFGLSALSSVLTASSRGKKFTRGMMTAGAAMVVVMGAAMFGNGASLSGLAMPVFAQASVQGVPAQIEGGVQVVKTELHSGQYEPITVQVGTPVRWTIHAEPGTVNGCNNRIIIPEYGRMQKQLETGDNVVEFTPTRSGTFVYTCWMGMIRGKITVLDETGSGSDDDRVLTAELPPDLFADFDSAYDSDPFADIFADANGGDASSSATNSATSGGSCCPPAASGPSGSSGSIALGPRRFLESSCSPAPTAAGPRRVQTQQNCCGGRY
jgi:plastocyanin